MKRRKCDRSCGALLSSRVRHAAMMVVVPPFFLISCGRKADSGPVLARVGRAVISQHQYEQRFKKLTMLTPIDNAQMREALLEAMIDEQVLLIEADRRGLREEEDFKEQSQARRIDAVLDAYRDAIADTRAVVQEQEVIEAFALANEKAAARHLYAPTLAEANTLYAKLQAGATFEELAPTVFKDYRLASSGGYLGYFKWEEMDPTFAAVAQQLKKGEISKPVQTKYGYSIIKMEDRVRESFLTETEYAQQRKRLKWITEHRKRAREIQKLDAETLAGLNLQFNESALDQIWQQIEDALADSNRLVEQAAARAALPEEAVVVSVSGPLRADWTVKDFQERALWTSERQRGRVQSRQDLKDFVSGLVLREEYLRRAKRAGFDKNPRVQQLVREHEDRFLLSKMRSLLTDSVRVPMDSLRLEYETQPENYLYPAMVKTREIVVSAREQAEHLLVQLRRGADFSELAKRYSIRRWSAERGGEVGYVTRGDLGPLGDGVFNLKTGEIGGPFHQDEYSIIVQVLESKPSRRKTFEEARPEIQAVLLPIYRQRALQEKLHALRRLVTIAVDRQVLQKVRSPL